MTALRRISRSTFGGTGSRSSRKICPSGKWAANGSVRSRNAIPSPTTAKACSGRLELQLWAFAHSHETFERGKIHIRTGYLALSGNNVQIVSRPPLRRFSRPAKKAPMQDSLFFTAKRAPTWTRARQERHPHRVLRLACTPVRWRSGSVLHRAKMENCRVA